MYRFKEAMKAVTAEKIMAALSGKFAKLKRLVLATLIKEGRPMTMRELAEKTGKGYSYIVTVVSELVNAGILKKEEDPEDRRRVLVWFKDESIIDTVRQHLQKVIEQLERERAKEKVEAEIMPPEVRELYDKMMNFVNNNVASVEISLEICTEAGERVRKTIPLTLSEIRSLFEKILEIPKLRDRILRELGLSAAS